MLEFEHKYLLLQAITHQFILLAEIHAAIGDDRLGPGIAVLETRLEGVHQAELGGVGLDQIYRAVLAPEDHMAIGVKTSAFALSL